MKKTLAISVALAFAMMLTPAANAGVIRTAAKGTVKVVKYTAPKAEKATVVVAKTTYKVGKAIFKFVF